MTQYVMICNSSALPGVGYSYVPNGYQGAPGGAQTIANAPILWYAPWSCDSVQMVEASSMGDIFAMTPAQGSEVAASMLLILAIGWSARALIRVLKSTDEGNENA